MDPTASSSTFARRPSLAASSVFEEADSEGMSEHAEEEDEENVELGHMQEVIPGLWLGDIVAAMDEESLKAANITSIMSIIRQDIPCPPGIKLLPIPIDDGPSTDILSHLPKSVEWIQAAIQGGEGNVLVHCQAGMSRSATVVAAYLMHQLSISPDEAIDMIREKRRIIQPSDTFMEQLQLYYLAHCRVSTRDRTTRQWYMERNAASVMNEGEPPAIDKMAKYPATPTPSMPPSPAGGHGRRKIRCKMCRRHLATREHMMDHILDQSPATRSRTPSTSINLPSPLSGGDGVPASQPRSRTPSVSQMVRPPSGLGGPRTSELSISSSHPGGPQSSRIQERRNSESAPGPRKYMDAESLASRLPPQLAALRAGVPSPGSKIPASTSPFSPSSVMDMPMTDSPRPASPTIPPPAPSMHSRSTSRDATSIPESTGSIGNSLAMLSNQPSNDLPLPGLDATPSRRNSLRAAGLAMSIDGSGTGSGSGDSGERSEGHKTAAHKLSMLALTPSEGGTANGGRPQISLDTQVAPNTLSTRRNSATQSPSFPTTGPPILVNPKCSGYFVEPLTWMEPMLAAGELQGKIVCPNEKCGAKIGNYDWAGVQCGCKEWVVPGFCISRSKVDEVW